ncbi:MAG: MaoC family dehydratase [Acidobacteriota bacterium]|nr:MaoC family dehydratase [Acidobacteriota bacterium]
MVAKESWTGRVFEDFAVGDVYEHPIGRTVTTADNVWFTAITMNPNPIHFDHMYAAASDFGKPLVNSCFTIALVTGLSVSDMSQNAVNLGWDAVRIPRPVFEGDTVYARSVVTESRESKSRPHQGIVGFNTEGYNQDGKTVLTFSRTMLVYRRGHVPPTPRPTS